MPAATIYQSRKKSSKYSANVRDAVIETHKDYAHFLKWLEHQGYKLEHFKQVKHYAIPEEITDIYKSEFYHDGEPDECWLTAKAFAAAHGFSTPSFWYWIRKNPDKRRRLRYINRQRVLIPPAIQLEYMQLGGVVKSSTRPKRSVPLKVISQETHVSYPYRYKHWFSYIILFRGTSYVDEGEAKALIMHYNSNVKKKKG